MPVQTPIFINAAACISPAGEGAAGAALPEGSRFRCIEPDYKEFIDPRLIRRMSRVVKMGTAAALACLREAGLDQPQAILTGTAYGCTEDTEQFLQKLVAQKEEMLTPTAFIQSTHNTIGAQIALLLQCHAYNSTYVHRAFSFEHALLDAVLLLREKEVANALVGGVDEMPDTPFAILNRFGLFRKTKSAGETGHSAGAIAGEGAAFFLLASEKTAATQAELIDLTTIYKPGDPATGVEDFLRHNELRATDIDLVLSGHNGDPRCDETYQAVRTRVFPHTPAAGFKHLCGEYPVATAFATWLATQILAGKPLPPGILTGNGTLPGTILIYNHFYHMHHSLILLRAC